MRRKVVDWTPWADLQKLKDIVNTMDSHSVAVYQKKKDALAKGDDAEMFGEGKDIMSVLREHASRVYLLALIV